MQKCLDLKSEYFDKQWSHFPNFTHFFHIVYGNFSNSLLFSEIVFSLNSMRYTLYLQKWINENHKEKVGNHFILYAI